MSCGLDFLLAAQSSQLEAFPMELILTIVVVVVVLFILFKVFKIAIRLALVFVFLVIAYFTNPNADDHRRAVKEKALETNVKLNGRTIQISDYKIFSLTKLVSDEEEKLVGVGLFTKVWIFRDL